MRTQKYLSAALLAGVFASAGNFKVESAVQAPNAAPTNVQAAALSTATTDTVFQDLRNLWDNCNRLKSTTMDIKNEGRNSPSRKKWMDYYLSNVKDDLAGIKSASAALHLPAPLAATVSSQWQDALNTIGQLDSQVAKLDAEVQNLKSPTDDKYPPAFWKPADELSQSAQKLDNVITALFSAADASLDQTNPANTALIADASHSQGSEQSKAEPLKGQARMTEPNIGFKHISDASQHVSKACFSLFGELERWNLLYGKPPAGGIGDGFYGGGLTPSEVTSEYKYLPTFTFTNAPYVMLYSYRLPPRQNMLAYYTGQLGKLLNLMESELNDVQIPADRQQALSGPWNSVKQLFLDARAKYLDLYKQVNNTTDSRLQKNIREDQTSFGPPIMAIYSDMSKLRDSIDDLNKIAHN